MFLIHLYFKNNSLCNTLLQTDSVPPAQAEVVPQWGPGCAGRHCVLPKQDWGPGCAPKRKHQYHKGSLTSGCNRMASCLQRTSKPGTHWGFLSTCSDFFLSPPFPPIKTFHKTSVAQSLCDDQKWPEVTPQRTPLSSFPVSQWSMDKRKFLQIVNGGAAQEFDQMCLQLCILLQENLVKIWRLGFYRIVCRVRHMFLALPLN